MLPPGIPLVISAFPSWIESAAWLKAPLVKTINVPKNHFRSIANLSGGKLAGTEVNEQIARQSI
jgi:hypothetical protein